MAIFRKVHTSFWSDSFISELNHERKLFYIYLLTNERTKQCGVYEITKKQISFDLGYSIDTVSKHLEYFIKTGKIKYNLDTKELAIGNWLKYNNSTSHLVQTCINNEFAKVKDRVLIEYVKSMNTQLQEEEEQEQEEEQEKKEEEEKKLPTLKIKYLDSVTLSDSEYKKLLSKYAQHEVNWMIDCLNNYKMSSGMTYKSDYYAIRKWVIDAFEKAKKDFIKNNNTSEVRIATAMKGIENINWDDYTNQL
jgi:hypothetical protein